jgi:hypothetical protein
MTVYSKPAVGPAWAETAGGGDLTAPSAGYVQAGWPLSNTPPARQYFNWILNWVANGVRYFMQRGVPDYDAAETYSINATVLGPDGLLYASITNSNTGHTPASSPTQWGPIETVTPAPGDNSHSVATTAYVLAAGFAPTASPALTGVPTAPTAAGGTSTSQIATTAFVMTAGFAPTASPALTGNPTAPTQATADNSTKLATTAFVKAAIAAGFSETLASPGSITFPGGLMMQWGTLAAWSDSAYHAFAFPAAFPNACFGVWPAPYQVSQNSAVAGAGTSVFITQGLTRTGFNYIESANWNNGVIGMPLYWLAIGY